MGMSFHIIAVCGTPFQISSRGGGHVFAALSKKIELIFIKPPYPTRY
jgi:hypothetical protein